MLAVFMDEFEALPRDLTGKRILDIGCWTGGTTLLLAAMGAEVIAIEEVKKYVDASNFLKESFALKNVTFLHSSLYKFTDEEYFGAFDYVLFAGVVYHLTDPIVGARIAYNATKDGGYCLVESEAIPNNGSDIQFHGSDIIWGGTREQLNRGGWNWFVPSPAIMAKWMREAGFVNVRENEVKPPRGRAFVVGMRDRHRDLNRAGLSVPDIR